MGAPCTHAPRDSPGCERGRYTESGDRATVGCANEAHISPADRCWSDRTHPCSGFRNAVIPRGMYLPGSRGATGCEPPCRADTRLLLVSLHSAQTSNADVHAGRRISRRHACFDRLRRCGREAQLTGMASLHDSFPLAIPAFHGDCLDVPRGLRAGRICGPSARNRESYVHWMAKRAAKPRVTVSHSCAARLEARQSGGHGWNAVAQSEFPLFCRETRRCSIEYGRPPAAVGICYLSSLSVRSRSAHQGLRQNQRQSVTNLLDEHNPLPDIRKLSAFWICLEAVLVDFQRLNLRF